MKFDNLINELRKIAKFEKVSYQQFKKDMIDTYGEISDKSIKEIYDGIKLPKRATTGSAGYDFFAPVNYEIPVGKNVKIPTGIRVKLDNSWVMKCYPRSSFGFKYRMQIDNTVPIIDADYYNAKNEGHIFIKLSCDSYDKDTILKINEGEAFVQGIFLPYGITVDDDTDGIRVGGIGSTSK
jgi:dUTP pyrophosphatase